MSGLNVDEWDSNKATNLAQMFKNVPTSELNLKDWDMSECLKSMAEQKEIGFTQEELNLISDAIGDSIHYYHEFGEVAFSDELKAFRALASKIEKLMMVDK